MKRQTKVRVSRADARFIRLLQALRAFSWTADRDRALKACALLLTEDALFRKLYDEPRAR